MHFLKGVGVRPFNKLWLWRATKTDKKKKKRTAYRIHPTHCLIYRRTDRTRIITVFKLLDLFTYMKLSTTKYGTLYAWNDYGRWMPFPAPGCSIYSPQPPVTTLLYPRESVYSKKVSWLSSTTSYMRKKRQRKLKQVYQGTGNLGSYSILKMQMFLGKCP